MQQTIYTIVDSHISNKNNRNRNNRRNNNNYIWQGKRKISMVVAVAQSYIDERRRRIIRCISGNRYNNTGWYRNARRMRMRSSSGKGQSLVMSTIDRQKRRRTVTTTTTIFRRIHPFNNRDVYPPEHPFIGRFDDGSCLISRASCLMLMTYVAGSSYQSSPLPLP